MSPQRFIATKQHRRFVEFADAVRRQHTIGICYGQAGIGVFPLKWPLQLSGEFVYVSES